MKRAAVMVAMLAVACSPQPRAASYFEAHPDIAQQAMTQCASGAARGAECETAAAGLAKHQADERLNLLRKSS